MEMIKSVEKREPERRCIGCGRRGPQSGFLRLTLDAERSPAEVVPARGAVHPGRGAYLCRSRACLDRALQRRAFQRAFRGSVAVDGESIATILKVEDRQGSTDDMAGG